MFKLIYPKFWYERGIVSYLLWPFSKIYQFFSFLRCIVQNPIKFPAKVVCIGNITVGGTGKTQLAIWIAKKLSANNIKFVIITKGYGSKINKPTLVNENHTPEEVGDEALILSEYGKVISAPRIDKALELAKSLKPEIIIVDDGMQNPRFHKDTIIVTIDATRGFGNRFLLPAGPLRQSINNGLRLADCAVVVGNEAQLERDIPVNCDIPILKAKILPLNNISKTKKYLAFCGIGNPERFFSSLEQNGIKVIKKRIFPDHYKYSSKDLALLKEQAKNQHALLITTEKDYVKVKHLLSAVCFKVELSISNDKLLTSLIYGSTFAKNK